MALVFCATLGFGQEKTDTTKDQEKTEQVSKTKTLTEEQKIEYNVQRILKKRGFIKNRNYNYIRGIEGYVKGVYVMDNKIYMLLELINKTNIQYDISHTLFYALPLKKKDRINIQEKTFSPIFSTEPQKLEGKSKTKVVYVFDKFTISDDKTLFFVMNEIEGERTLKLEIKPKYIYNAKN